jgi:arylsulfatase A-like enzyme
VSVPPQGKLETHLSFARSELSALGTHTCRAQVEASDGGAAAPTVLHARDLTPAGHWEHFQVDLSALGGRTIELRLRLECPRVAGGVGPGAVRWSVPVLSRPRVADERNVLLITIDTLRPDHLGAYGYSRPTSPQIDALARRGLVFEHAETVQSATWPALTSLHTSLHPSAHGVVWNGHRFAEGFTTLAEVLHANHYSTSACITNMTRGRHPGFSRLDLSRSGGQAGADRAAVDQAREQLLLEKDRRFFMWVHLLSPHADYAPPPPYDTAFTRSGASSVPAEIDALASLRRRGVALEPADVAHVVGLYDGEIAYVDDQVGRLLGALRELDLEKNTLVVLTADHGEDLYEHNGYFFHSPSIYGSSMRIPLVFALPGGLAPGRVTELASLVDVAPTVLGLLGLPAPPEFSGANLLPQGRAPHGPVHDAVFGETHGIIQTVRTKEWRFVRNPDRVHPDAPGGPYPIAGVELYDLRKDPGERLNLAEGRPEIVRAFDAELQSFQARHRLKRGGGARGVDPEALEELRALGYLGN